MRNENNIGNVAILICSYDGAEDLWEPIHQTYKKYWEDCPYTIYLATNYKNPNLELFKVIAIGDEVSWSDNVLKCLDEISEKYILLTFDDLFLHKKIKTQLVESFVNIAIKNNWAYLRLHPSPLPDEYVSKEIGKISHNRLYRSSTVWAIFKKTVLIDLLDRKESAWEFERLGSIRSDKYEHFYCSNVSVIPYINGVVKGRWVPDALEKLESDGIYIRKDERKKMTYLESRFESLKRLRLKLFLRLIPANLRLRVKRLINN